MKNNSKEPQSKLYDVYKSPLGEIYMLSNDGVKLSRLWFENQKYAPEIEDEIHISNHPVFEEVKKWLDAYFQDKDILPIPELELRGTNFQKSVWSALSHIKYGETATYTDIAEYIGCKSPRPVATAIAQNPIIIMLPCHRVIAKNGDISGFAAGVERKKWLLKHEAATKMLFSLSNYK